MDAAADLIAFTEYTFKAYQTAEIHRVIASQLERVEQGEVHDADAVTNAIARMKQLSAS
jgi:hypothetical protein